MSYQKCPICYGAGYTNRYFPNDLCPTCNGKRIICELTGKPPKEESKTNGE